jgi:uncharacterized membrane protein
METEAAPTAAAPARRSLRLAATVVALGVFIGGFIAFAAWNGTWYQTWRALHVLAAIVWVGGGVMLQLLAVQILKTNDPDRLAKFAKDVEYISLRTFIPASLVLLALGFVLMDQGGWEYKFWVIFALVGFGLSFLSGVLVISPESGRIAKLTAERGGVDEEIAGRIERLILYSRVELALIALITMDMILKPGL